MRSPTQRWSEIERDIVLPGFINGHDHVSEALISGLGETLNLYEWIERLIRPVVPHLEHRDGPRWSVAERDRDAALGNHLRQ